MHYGTDARALPRIAERCRRFSSRIRRLYRVRECSENPAQVQSCDLSLRTRVATARSLTIDRQR